MRLKIFQIDADKDHLRLRFMDSRFLERTFGKFRVDPTIYKCVFDGEIPVASLQDVFILCNSDVRPKGYNGHSLSVSDVIAVEDDCPGRPKGFYFCDTFGFRTVLFDPAKADSCNI